MTVEELIEKDKLITESIIEYGECKGISRKDLLWDGVASAEKYLDENNKYKIMWILKESHEKPGTCGYKAGVNIAEDRVTKDGKIITAENERKRSLKVGRFGKPINPTLHGMTYVTYGLLNNIRYEDMIKHKTVLEMSESLTRIASANIRKDNGKTTSPRKRIEEGYEIWKRILFRQIEIYNPDILIFGGTFDFFKRDWIEKYGDISLKDDWFFQDNMLVIITAHPSYPFRKEAKIKIKDYVDSIIERVEKALKEKENRER